MFSNRVVVAFTGVLALIAASIIGSPSPATAQTSAQTPEQIYAQVADAVTLISTPLGRGSGILIDQRRIVTDAHVVSPFSTVTVRFRDGRTDAAARVIGLDLMADLAVLELSSSVPYRAAPLGSSAGLAIGAELYLIGYPGSLEANDQPTISRGLLSRFREWDAIGMTYLETDAAVAPGQSGGPVVNANGVVVGVLQFALGSGFAITASGEDVSQRVQALISGQDVDGIGNRTPSAPAQTNFTFTLADFVDEEIFLVPPSASGGMSVTVDGQHDAAIGFFRADGYWVDIADASLTGREFLSATLPDEPIQYFVVVRQYDEAPGTFTLTSTTPLIPVTDPDTNQLVVSGDVYAGALDYPDDVDTFTVDLEAGQHLTARVESVTFDAVVLLDHPGDSSGVLAADDDGGGGLFGTDAELEFTATSPGRYRLIVYPYFTEHRGGYILSVTIGEPPAATGPAFSSSISRHGVSLVSYGGGHVSQLVNSAAIEGCYLSSFWVADAGRLIGYVVGAPAFVNEEMLWRFPGGQIPAGTPMLLSCD